MQLRAALSISNSAPYLQIFCKLVTTCLVPRLVHWLSFADWVVALDPLDPNFCTLADPAIPWIRIDSDSDSARLQACRLPPLGPPRQWGACNSLLVGTAVTADLAGRTSAFLDLDPSLLVRKILRKILLP